MLESFQIKLKPMTKEEANIKDQLVFEIEELFKKRDISCQVAQSVLEEAAYRQKKLEDILIEETKYKDIFPTNDGDSSTNGR